MFSGVEATDMKQCLSLSSLRQGGDSGPDHSGLDSSGDHNNSPASRAPNNDNVRLYHSLTKRPRRRSPWFDSPVADSPCGLDAAMTRLDTKDEFWAAIQRDYNYLMGRQLIDTCCQELLANSSQQGTSLADKHGAELSSSDSEAQLQQQPPASSPISDVETELRGMKQWLCEAEVRLGPGITECRDLTRLVVSGQQRELKMSEHKGLHREIESRGRVLSTLLRLCDRLNSSSPTALSAQKKDLSPHRRARALKLAQRLHKRWQILYLKNLEWILHLETNTSAEVVSDSSDSLSDGDDSVTPARKKRMLSAPLLTQDSMSPEVNSAMCPEDKQSDCTSNSSNLEALEHMDFEAQMYAAFNRSGRSKVANSAVFYFKHSTTEQSSNSSDNEEDEWTFTSINKGAGCVRARLNFDSPLHKRRSSCQEPLRGREPTSGEASEDTSEAPSSPSPSPQILSDCSASPSSEDLNTSVATCIGQSSPEKVVMRPKRSPQRVKRRPVSLPFSLMSPESPLVTPTSKTCSETNLAAMSRKKRTMRRSKRRLQRASQSSESEELMFRLSVLNQVSGIIKSSSFSGTCQVTPPRLDGSYSDPSHTQTSHRRSSKSKVFVPPIRVRDVTEESGEPSWDSYQERYNSEAYSEDLVDSETARKLLEFGDDYSRYLREEFSDSSTNRRPISESSSSRRRRDSKLPPLAPDSDSEVEELRYILKLSQDSLVYTSQRLQEATDKFDALINDMRTLGPENILNIGELAEMAATCRESKKCVALVISRIEHDTSGIADLQLIYDLLDRWEDLEAKTQELQRASSLARQVASLRQALGSLSAHQAERMFSGKPRSPRSRMECRLSLQMKLEAIKDQFATLLGIKSQLSDTNLLIHRLSTEDNGTFRQQIKSMLKVQIAELFELWDQTNYELECELNKTEDHLVAWEELDRQLSMLRGSLLRDREVLLSGHRSKEVSDCGSLSDSGISDAGSDVLEVREKELTSLRALANQLPLQSRQDIVQELDAAEKELEQLRLYSSQRNLAMSCDPGSKPTSPLSSSECVPSSCGDSRGPRHWVKYVPLCLVTLLAIVCTLLQPPNCCEYVNSGLGKYWEQLRFHNGPPPV